MWLGFDIVEISSIWATKRHFISPVYMIVYILLVFILLLGVVEGLHPNLHLHCAKRHQVDGFEHALGNFYRCTIFHSIFHSPLLFLIVEFLMGQDCFSMLTKNFFIEIPFLVSFNFPFWTTFWYDFQSRCIPSNWLSYCFSIVVPKWKFSIF